MKTLFFVITFSLYVAASSAQQVVATTGHTWSVPGYTVEWTLGEIAVQTYSAPGIVLTQGMHQPGLFVTDIYDFRLNFLKIKVYPNPVDNILNMEIIQSGNLKFRYELSDITGRIFQVSNIQSNRMEINLDNYRPGIYLLRIITTDSQSVKLYKIVKR